MKKIMLSPVLLVLFLCCSQVVVASENDQDLTRLLEISGLTKQMGEYPGMIKAGMSQARQQGTELSDKILELMLDSVDDTIVPGEMISGVREKLVNGLEAGETEGLFSWYQSALGRKITQLEEAASTPEAFSEMQNMAESLMADSERVAMAKELDDLLGVTDFSLGLQGNTRLAVISAFSKVMHPGEALNLDELKSQISAQLEKIRGRMTQFVMVSFLYTYRDLSSEEIKKYIEFLKVPATRKFNRIVMAGIDAEMIKAIGMLGEHVAKELKDKQESEIEASPPVEG